MKCIHFRSVDIVTILHQHRTEAYSSFWFSTRPFVLFWHKFINLVHINLVCCVCVFVCALMRSVERNRLDEDIVARCALSFTKNTVKQRKCNTEQERERKKSNEKRFAVDRNAWLNRLMFSLIISLYQHNRCTLSAACMNALSCNLIACSETHAHTRRQWQEQQARRQLMQFELCTSRIRSSGQQQQKIGDKTQTHTMAGT